MNISLLIDKLIGYNHYSSISRSKDYTKELSNNYSFLESSCVLMLCYKRIDRLPTTLELLSKQTRPVKLYLWNNNPDTSKKFEEICNKYTDKLDITITQAKSNSFGFPLYYMGSKLEKKVSYIITIDDDQEFEPSMVENFHNEYSTNTIIGYWAFKLNNPKIYGDRQELLPGEKAGYVGAGGTVYDTSIFKNILCFSCPKEYRSVMDLWLSYVATHYSFYNLLKSSNNLEIIEDSIDIGPTLKDLKSEFLTYLTSKGEWELPV